MLNKLTLTLLAVLLATGTAMAAFAAPAAPVNPEQIRVDPALAAMFAEDGKQITTADFLELTPKKVREATGKRLGLKNSITLKIAQKAIKKQMKQEAKTGVATGAAKSQIVALVLAIVLGGLRVHRFYLGYVGIGIAQIALLLTSFLIVPGIALFAWVLIDIIRIATGSLGPKDGSAYDPAL